MRIALSATGAVSRLPIANENDPMQDIPGRSPAQSCVAKRHHVGEILLAGGFELAAFPPKVRNVSTTLRQPAFEFKLGFLAFGLAG